MSRGKKKDIIRDPSDTKLAISGYYEQFYNNTFRNIDNMDKFLEKYT